MRRVLRQIRRYWMFLVLSIALAAVSVASQLVVPILTGDAIDAMLGAGQVDFPLVWRTLLLIAASVAVSSVVQWLFCLCNNHIVYRVSRDLRDAAVEKIQHLPLSYLDAHPSGDLVSRIIADVEQFTDGLLMGFTQLLTGVLTIFGTLFFMFAVNPVIALVVVCVTPLSFVAAGFLTRRTYRSFRLQSEVRGEQTAFLNEMVEGRREVRSFGHEKESEEQFEEINERLRVASQDATFFSSLTNPTTRFVNSVVYAGVALSGALYAVAGGITVGQLSCFLSYTNQYTKPFNEISGVIAEMQNALACARRIFSFLDEQEERPDPEDAQTLRADGRVELSNVSFRYEPERKLIESLSLSVKSGWRVAIVGETGSGKTTLINLLLRFYEVDSGQIRVSGIPVREITRHSLRCSYGMVLQDTWLFSGTVHENIAYGKPDAKRSEVEAAAKAAHAHAFIQRLPLGYDTVLTEDCSLSQGQKQLLCIARVMLHLPPMLILDEATSSIDTRTEMKIQSAFTRMMQGRTSFIVAHRLSTIRETDLIVVMQDGAVVEQGTHEELLAKKGVYAKLYYSQFEM